MLTVNKTKKAISLSFALMLLLIFFCAWPVTVKALASPGPPLSVTICWAPPRPRLRR